MTEGHTPELIERIERATGPCLTLDRDIALAIYPGASAVAQCDARISVWDSNGRTQLTVKSYSASLDAAMTLVPTEPYPELCPGQWWWMIEAWPNEKTAHVAYENGDSGIPEFSGKGATPALALCAASLKARAIP